METSLQKKGIGIGAIMLVVALIVAYWLSTPNAPDFSQYLAGEERKDAFFSYFLPIIQQRNAEIRSTREDLKQWRENPGELGWWDSGTVSDLATSHGMDGFDPSKDAHWDRLLKRVDIVPPSLALAQAANESAWGTSRFARQGYNYFGQWCFQEGCGMVPGSRDAGKSHEVAVFDSPADSVRGYILNLNRNSAYAELRQIRANLRQQDKPITGVALADGLGRYSERGQEYIKELKSMIRYNKLGQYDPGKQ